MTPGARHEHYLRHRGLNLFFLSLGGLACLVLALAVYAVAALGGGPAYADQLGGNVSLAVLIAGTVFFAVAALLTRPEE